MMVPHGGFAGAGNPPPGDYYRLEPRPVEEFDEAAMKAHREAVGTVAPEGAELREPRPEDIANTTASVTRTQEASLSMGV